MPSQIRAPYGDIVSVTTPYLDSAAKQLYAEQKQRQMIQYQENKALDESMRKEFANVRSVDVPELINSFSQYKGFKKQSLFDKNLQKDPQAYNQVQQQANEALQNVYSIINGSAELKNMSKSLLDQSIKNPDSLADDARQKLAILNNTPYSQVRSHPQYGDLTNMDQYIYKGSDTDYGKLLHEAAGTPKDILGKTVPIDGGLQNQTSVYQFGNTPAQVYDYLNGATAVRKTGRSASYKWDQTSPDQIQATIDKYKQIPQEKWGKMGLSGPQDLGNFTDNKADNWNKLMAMNYAINAEPKEGKPIIKQNEKAMLDYKFAQDKVMEGIKFGHQKALKQQEQQLVDNWIVDYWNQRFGDVSTEKPKAFTVPNPNNPLTMKTTLGRQLNPDQVMMEALKNNGVYPNEIYSIEDNKILPVFYKYKNITNDRGTVIGTDFEKDANGNKVIDEDLSKPLSLDQAYLSMGYKGQTKKQLGGTMQGTYKEQPKKKNDPLGLF